MSYRLAAIDLDDTLLAPDKSLSPENRAALDRLRGAGIEVVLASGRHHDNMSTIAHKFGIGGWIISSQGAVLRHIDTPEPVYELTMPIDLALDVYAGGRERGLTLLGYHRTGVFSEVHNEWTALYARRSGFVPAIGDLRELIQSGMQKLLWLDDGAKIGPLVAPMQDFYRDRLCVVQTEEEHLEFISAEASKARGGETLARRLGITADEVLAFGDGNNDVPMLEWAGMSVAMDHGRESARKAAKKVTPPGPQESAFARAVEMVLS
jgi:Cof subfamily protein (haloacid dehalogenase superfamily)